MVKKKRIRQHLALERAQVLLHVLVLLGLLPNRGPPFQEVWTGAISRDERAVGVVRQVHRKRAAK